MHDDQHRERGGGGHDRDDGFGAPGDRHRGGGENEQCRQRQRGMGGGVDQHERAEQITREHAGADLLDASALGGRTVEQSGDDEDGGEPKAGRGVEGMRRQRAIAGIADADEHPRDRQGGGRDREPAPEPEARERVGGGGDDRQVDIERPVVRLLRGDQQRRHIGADQAKPAERRSVHQRSRERCERDEPEKEEGERGREELVERIGGPDVGIGDRRAGRGENARDMRARHVGEAGDDLPAPRQFADADQCEREHAAADHPQPRAEQTLLDRVAHQQDAAERQCDAADPHHPLRAEALFQVGEIGTRRGQGRWRRCAVDACRRRLRLFGSVGGLRRFGFGGRRAAAPALPAQAPRKPAAVPAPLVPVFPQRACRARCRARPAAGREAGSMTSGSAVAAGAPAGWMANRPRRLSSERSVRSRLSSCSRRLFVRPSSTNGTIRYTRPNTANMK